MSRSRSEGRVFAVAKRVIGDTLLLLIQATFLTLLAVLFGLRLPEAGATTAGLVLLAVPVLLLAGMLLPINAHRSSRTVGSLSISQSKGFQYVQSEEAHPRLRYHRQHRR